MKRIRIEQLEQELLQGKDPQANYVQNLTVLTDIFAEASLAAEKVMNADLQNRHGNKRVNGTDEPSASLELERLAALQRMLANSAGKSALIELFETGRYNDENCIPSLRTRQYYVTMQAMNDSLKRRGYDLAVY